MLSHYRKDKNITKGYSVFNRLSFDYEFTNWVKLLSQDKLNHILRKYENKLTSLEILCKCTLINEDLEILKFLAYKLMYENVSEYYLSEVTGKGVDFIKRYAKLIFDEKIRV